MEAPPDLSSNDDVGLEAALATTEPAVCAECGEPARYLVSGRSQSESGVCGLHLEGAMNAIDPARVRLVPGVSWA